MAHRESCEVLTELNFEARPCDVIPVELEGNESHIVKALQRRFVLYSGAGLCADDSVRISRDRKAQIQIG